MEQLVWPQFTLSFHGFKPGPFAHFEPEVKAFLWLFLWRVTISSKNATGGQPILHIQCKKRCFPEAQVPASLATTALPPPVLKLPFGVIWQSQAPFVLYVTSPERKCEVGFEYMTRELLCHGFAEFRIFLLPRINIQKLKAE
ncbi:hypothetical protein GH733_010712 [Mirounga leonina]|nr:hypothetical protein GH733_010712 [Mirounga leonina]